jgi:hypothetical protein
MSEPEANSKHLLNKPGCGRGRTPTLFLVDFEKIIHLGDQGGETRENNAYLSFYYQDPKPNQSEGEKE